MNGNHLHWLLSLDRILCYELLKSADFLLHSLPDPGSDKFEPALLWNKTPALYCPCWLNRTVGLENNKFNDKKCCRIDFFWFSGKLYHYCAFYPAPVDMTRRKNKDQYLTLGKNTKLLTLSTMLTLFILFKLLYTSLTVTCMPNA